MPKLKKETFRVTNAAGVVCEEAIDVHVSADGTFYAKVPHEFYPAFAETCAGIGTAEFVKVVGHFKVTAKSYDQLKSLVIGGLSRYIQPEVTEENVIVYCTTAQVQFAVDADNNVFPNRHWPNTHWPPGSGSGHGPYSDGCGRYGFSLSIGAKACTKITTRYGSREDAVYKGYYGPSGDHLNTEEPAVVLNAWQSLAVGERIRGESQAKFKEIPYSDAAALFFCELLRGMAVLSRRVQDVMFEKDRLVDHINASRIPLLDLEKNDYRCAVALRGPVLNLIRAPPQT